MKKNYIVIVLICVIILLAVFLIINRKPKTNSESSQPKQEQEIVNQEQSKPKEESKKEEPKKVYNDFENLNVSGKVEEIEFTNVGIVDVDSEGNEISKNDKTTKSSERRLMCNMNNKSGKEIKDKNVVVIFKDSKGKELGRKFMKINLSINGTTTATLPIEKELYNATTFEFLNQKV